MFTVVRRIIPPHGIKVGCGTQVIAYGLTRLEARELADAMQLQNPAEEYATVENVFRYFTKPGSA